MVFVKWFERMHISGDCLVSASDDQILILILLRLLIYARVIAFAFATTTKQRCGLDCEYNIVGPKRVELCVVAFHG